MNPEKKREMGKLLFWISCIPLIGILIVIYFLFQMVAPEGIGWIIEKWNILFPVYAVLALACVVWHLTTRPEKMKRYAFTHISIVGLFAAYLVVAIYIL